MNKQNYLFKQYGMSITEFVIIAPLMLFIGLAAIQYGLLYNAKLNITYAAYEAARAGAIYNADPARIQNAFYKGLVPYFSTTGIYLPGNTHIKSPITSDNPNLVEIAAGGKLLQEAIKKTESAFVHIHMVNPSKASFDDWNDSKLARVYEIKTRQKVRIIPNHDLSSKANTLGKKSQQSIQDANVLKLRFVYGYEPRIPMMKTLFNSITAFFNSDRDVASARILAAGRIPIVVDISAQMLSPPIEGALPTNTVNRNGYIVGADLIDRITESQAMAWQVGYNQEDLSDSILDSAEKNLIQNLQSGQFNANSLTQIGSSLLGNSSPTGHLDSSTTQLVGDMNGLISCSGGNTITNFY